MQWPHAPLNGLHNVVEKWTVMFYCSPFVLFVQEGLLCTLTRWRNTAKKRNAWESRGGGGCVRAQGCRTFFWTLELQIGTLHGLLIVPARIVFVFSDCLSLHFVVILFSVVDVFFFYRNAFSPYSHTVHHGLVSRVLKSTSNGDSHWGF